MKGENLSMYFNGDVVAGTPAIAKILAEEYLENENEPFS